MPKRETVAQYYGSKLGMVDWLLEHTPEHLTSVEACAGMASWTLAKQPAQVEVINDQNINIPTLFKAMRDKPDLLARAVALTPYSLAEWERCVAALRQGGRISDLERARCFLVSLRQSGGTSPGKAWSRIVDHSRRGMASSCSRWINVPETIIRVADRLRTVQVDCMDFEPLILKYQAPQTLFYVDPPYLEEGTDPNGRKGRGAYGVYEWDEETHLRMLGVVHRSPAKFMISGYASRMYDSCLLERLGWRRYMKKVISRTNVHHDGSVGNRPFREEVLWVKK